MVSICSIADDADQKKYRGLSSLFWIKNHKQPDWLVLIRCKYKKLFALVLFL